MQITTITGNTRRLTTPYKVTLYFKLKDFILLVQKRQNTFRSILTIFIAIKSIQTARTRMDIGRAVDSAIGSPSVSCRVSIDLTQLLNRTYRFYPFFNRPQLFDVINLRDFFHDC